MNAEKSSASPGPARVNHGLSQRGMVASAHTTTEIGDAVVGSQTIAAWIS